MTVPQLYVQPTTLLLHTVYTVSACLRLPCHRRGRRCLVTGTANAECPWYSTTSLDFLWGRVKPRISPAGVQCLFQCLSVTVSACQCLSSGYHNIPCFSCSGDEFGGDDGGSAAQMFGEECAEISGRSISYVADYKQTL